MSALLPDGYGKDDPQPCKWCGSLTTNRIVVTTAVVRKIKGVPKVIEPERRVHACETCCVRLQRAPDPEEVRRHRKAENAAYKARQEEMF